MAGPWEDYAPAAAEPTSDGPWADYASAAPKKKFGLGDTWPARLAKSVYSAVTLPGDVLAGKVPTMVEDPITGEARTNPEIINRSAELASVASPVSPAARAGIGWAGALKTKEAPAPTREALETASDSGYDAARNMPFEMKSDAVRNWAAKTQADLEAKGRLQEFAPDTHAVLNKLQSGDPEAIATGGNLISAREALREASRNFNNPRDKAAAEIAIRGLDKFVSNPPEEAIMAGAAAPFAKTAEGARRDYAALSRSEQIADALRAADINAGKANSGQNLDNATRQRFASILLSDKNSAGYSAPEIAQMERVVKGSNLGDAARYVGNFMGGGGGLGAVHAGLTGGAAGYAAGGPVGAAVGVTAPAVGYGMKKLANYLTNKEVSKLDEMVRRRSALGETMPERIIGSVSPSRAALARVLMGGAIPQQQ